MTTCLFVVTPLEPCSSLTEAVITRSPRRDEALDRVQLGVVSDVAGLAVGGVPEQNAADVGDRVKRLPTRRRKARGVRKLSHVLILGDL